MADASDLILGGFVLRPDTYIVRYPERYIDKRGVKMWQRVIKLLPPEDVAA